MDWLLLRSRPEPPAREDAILPGRVRFAGALRRERPDRVSGSSSPSSSWSLICLACCGVSSSAVDSCSSFPLPLALDLRCCDFVLAGLCVGRISGGTSSSGSTSGRGLEDVDCDPLKLDRFQKLLADTGVPKELCGERAVTGVETVCLAWLTRGWTGGAPALAVPGVWTLGRGGWRLLAGVDDCACCGGTAAWWTRDGSCGAT